MGLTSLEFRALAAVLHEESAISLEPGKEYLLESRLAPLLRAEGHDTWAPLVRAVCSGGSARLRAAVVDAMTTNETSFFRDVHPWATLGDVVLPALVAARRDVRRLTFWCAASSSGQEPHSLAMLLRERFPEVADGWDVRIIGTDLSPTMVARSSEGRYTQLEVGRGLPAASLARWFDRVGTEWQLRDEITRMVEFRQGNLDDERCFATLPRLDGVLVRNVLIYFDDATRARVVARVRERLQPDGFLLLGSSEHAVGVSGRFERHQEGRTIFFRPSAPVAAGR